MRSGVYGRRQNLVGGKAFIYRSFLRLGEGVCVCVRCRAVRCGAVPCRAVPCGAVPCRVVPCGAVPCRVVPCRAVPCRAVSCRAVRCRAVSCRAVPCWVGGVGGVLLLGGTDRAGGLVRLLAQPEWSRLLGVCVCAWVAPLALGC